MKSVKVKAVLVRAKFYVISLSEPILSLKITSVVFDAKSQLGDGCICFDKTYRDRLRCS